MHPEKRLVNNLRYKQRGGYKKESLAIGVRGCIRVDKDVFEINP